MMYGNISNGFGYSPNRSYDVDRFNPSTRANYSTVNASGSRQGGYWHTATPSYTNKPKTSGRYLGNGQYVED